MCHIRPPPTNRNWGYCTVAFLSGSRTDDPNGTQVPSLPKTAQLLRRKIYETRGLEIRLSLSSTRSPGILSKILVLNLRFKATNYAKSWFHGHSCTVLPITTARRRRLWFLCTRRCCGLSLAVSMSPRCSAEPSGPIAPSHLRQPPAATAGKTHIPGGLPSLLAFEVNIFFLITSLHPFPVTVRFMTHTRFKQHVTLDRQRHRESDYIVQRWPRKDVHSLTFCTIGCQQPIGRVLFPLWFSFTNKSSAVRV